MSRIFNFILVQVSEKFSAEVEGLQCTFGMVYKGSKVDLRKSKVTCSKPKKTVKFTGEVTSDSGTVFSITLMVTKKGAKLLKASVSTGSSPGSGPTVGGSGSGRPPVGGSGSGGNLEPHNIAEDMPHQGHAIYQDFVS